MTDSLAAIDAERAEIRRHLERQYAGVFGPAEIEFHLNAHVGDAFADYACQVMAVATPLGSRILDVGAGYGSFVMLARARGFRAIGTEIAAFEVAYARRRLARERPGDDGDAVFLDQGIFHAALDGAQFEAITFWNVLEHIDDFGPVIARAAALLASGGAIYVVCPNYAAWRNEAHYQIPWRPFVTRHAASRRIRKHGKDPHFFETSVFQRTNWGLMAELKRHGLILYDRLNQTRMHAGRAVTSPSLFLDYYNPARAAVELAARKPA
ncbi:MAG: class I SAM-dependent methyltransferase [Acidobacteriota bacterium]|nr:class I SAM-dependent methyltransferase [Acidobacteriota bacterium]